MAAQIELDYMEYPSDAEAQAAYVSSEVYGSDECISGTPSASNGWFGEEADKAFDDNFASTKWNTGGTNYPPQWIQYQFTSGKKIIQYTVTSANDHSERDWDNWTLKASNTGDFTGEEVTVDTRTSEASGWTSRFQKRTFICDNPPSSAYIYYRFIITKTREDSNSVQVEEIEMMEVVLQSYSESTIKTQGSYSLKAIATQTDSLNKTLTKTVSPTIDLSNTYTIKFDIRASRIGTNIQAQIKDTEGTVTTHDINILTADTWQTEEWDISGVANVDKDAIDEIVFKIINADVDNTFYIDNMFVGYSFRKKITIDHTKVGSDLTDFPVLVKLDSTNFDFSKANSDGFDIRFTLSDGTTLLKYERERHDSVNQKAEYWVKIPSVSSTVDTEFYIYYRTADTEDGADPTNVWDSNYKARYDMKDLTASSIEDSTSNNNDGTKKGANEPNQVDGKIDKAQDFDGINDWVDSNEDAQFQLANGTVLAWIYLRGYPSAGVSGIVVKDQFGWHDDFIFSIGIDNVADTKKLSATIQREADTTRYQANDTADFPLNEWTMVAITWGSAGMKLYRNADNVGNNAYTGGIVSNGQNLTIGEDKQISDDFFDGLIDEVRISSIVRSADWIKASYHSGNNSLLSVGTEENVGGLSEEESIFLSDELKTSPEFLSKEESISLFDELKTNPEFLLEEESIFLSDELKTSPEFLSKEESISLSDELKIKRNLLKYLTDFRTKFKSNYIFYTVLETCLRKTTIYNSKLNTKATLNYKYNTDFRTKVSDYDSLQPGTLNDFLVKLDGIELTDIDYNTLNITYNRNSTPSQAVFSLLRYHDKIDYKADGTFSEISNENKIEIYDGTTKLFTGYITQITADSSEKINIVVQDVRFKIARKSMELWYGGAYDIEEGDINIKYEKNIGTAVEEVITEIGSLISGHESLTFGTSFIPEYVKRQSDCASLLTELITNTANAGWYIDENEKLKYYKIGQGPVKNLSLSSIDSKRHIYDIIVDNVVLNKRNNNYAKSYVVKLGKYINIEWSQLYLGSSATSSGALTSALKNVYAKSEGTDFRFQTFHLSPSFDHHYVGSRVQVYASSWTESLRVHWLLEYFITGQWLANYKEEDLDDIVVGTGEPKQTLYLNNYGKQTINLKWEEKSKAELKKMGYNGTSVEYQEAQDSDRFLVKYYDVNYDYSSFAKEKAEFDLSQVSKLKTTATVTLLLDAFNYYNIGLDSLINLTNTLQSNIYNNNNGFPLNIGSITINCSNRIVTLNLTNYGKDWYAKKINYLQNYIPIKIQSIQKKYPVFRHEFGGSWESHE